MIYLKEPIQWSKEEQIEAVSFIFKESGPLIKKISEGYSLLDIKMIQRNPPHWDTVLLYVPFIKLPLVNTKDDKFASRALEFRLKVGK